MASIDKTKCLPCGLCFSTHPEVFVLWKDGKAEVVNEGNLTPEQQAIYDEVKWQCPVWAIE